MPNTAASDEAAQPRLGYEFADERGSRAWAWWCRDGWLIEADDPKFCERITGALKQPIWIWETTVGADGVPSCRQVQVPPSGLRYLRGLPMAWGQLPLDDVDIRVVALDDGTVHAA